MESFINTHKKKIYILIIMLILAVGIVLRSGAIDLRVLFTDEAVHFNFIRKLTKSQPYKYTEVVKLAHFGSVNDALNVYNYFDTAIKEKGSIWEKPSYSSVDYLQEPQMIGYFNLLVQPYYYVKHLIGNGIYRYDPVYHGPFLYYIGDLVFNLAGENSIFLLRLPIVIASILSLFFVFLYRRMLGKFGFVVALMLIASSPALVYYSNLGNYENYIASFNILGVGLLLLGIYRRSPWILFLSGVVLLALMTIKETALVAWFCIVVATILTYVVLYIKQRPSTSLKKFEDYIINTFLGTYNKNILKYLLPAILCFICGGAIFAALYSSFGGNPDGIHDGLTSWMYWKNTGGSSGHVKAFAYYTEIVLTYDFTIVFLFFTGAVVTIFSTRDKYKLFIVFWAFIIWLVYSIIPYKTPWLVINFLLPFAIVAGIGWEIIFNMLTKKTYKFLIAFFVLILTINATTIAIGSKWFKYDDPNNRMTYVHTYREFEEEVMAIYTLTQASPDGNRTNISIAAPEYWPLPAYLYGHRSVGYFNGVKGRNLNLNAPIVINDTRDNPELREFMLESDINDFFKLRDFHQRPGVDHSIYVKEDLLKRYIDGKYYDNWIRRKDNTLLHQSTRNVFF